MMSDLFRCAGDIIFDDHPPLPGQISDVQLKQFSETSNFLQCLKPLTPESPYFFGQIRALTPESKITIGIAGSDIQEDARPGQWNSTVGYCSDTGKCYTSHSVSANTYGEKFGIGDVFGLKVTYFGKQMSTITFVKNGQPVATRYHFESDITQFLPTITLENGPIDLGIMWPQAAIGKPNFSDKNMLHWIRHPDVQYDAFQKMFVTPRNKNTPAVLPVQCPQPFSREFEHYEVIVKETSPEGAGPAVGIASCSPLKPSPTCEILKDFFRWMPDGKANKTRVDQRIGFGIHYSPDKRSKPDFNDKDQQLVLCFVSLDTEIVYCKMMLQPEGGFYPLFLLNEATSKVVVDVESNRNIKVLDHLDKLYKEALLDASDKLHDDRTYRDIKMESLRKSNALSVTIPEQTLTFDISRQYCRVHLPHDKMGIHVIQFQKPLTTDSSYFCMEIKKLNEDSVVSIGVTNSKFPLNKHPGKLPSTVGWTSRDGRLYYNGRFDGNIIGERYSEGDAVGLDITSFDVKWPVALFSKNCCPVGTRYVTLSDKHQFFPTVSLCGNGYDVVVDIYWQNKNSIGPVFDLLDLESWCLPEGSKVDVPNRTIYVTEHVDMHIIQCPYAFESTLNFDYYEIELIDKFGDGNNPPGIALTSPCFQDLNQMTSSNFRQDFVRFMAVDEAQKSVSVGSSIGWGIIVPESEQKKRFDRLVICYLAIDRSIALTRVIYEPPGGLHPLILLPQGVNRVKVGNVLHIQNHPITKDVIDTLLSEANEIIAKEKVLISEGKDIDELRVDKAQLYKPLVETVQKAKEKPNFGDVVFAATAIEKSRKKIVQSKSCVIL